MRALPADVYLPAMPTTERQLHGDSELTITGFYRLFLPCSSFEDLLAIIGRKIPLFIGMALFAIGSVGCAISDAMVALFFGAYFRPRARAQDRC